MDCALVWAFVEPYSVLHSLSSLVCDDLAGDRVHLQTHPASGAMQRLSVCLPLERHGRRPTTDHPACLPPLKKIVLFALPDFGLLQCVVHVNTRGRHGALAARQVDVHKPAGILAHLFLYIGAFVDFPFLAAAVYISPRRGRVPFVGRSSIYLATAR